MGIVLNIYKRPRTLELKTRTEELAILTQQGLVEVYLGTAQFDKASQHFLAGQIKEVAEALTSAFKHLSKARLKLKDVLALEFEMYNCSSESLEQITDDSTNLDSLFYDKVREIQRIIQVIDHIEFISAEKADLDLLDKNDISEAYEAISNLGKELVLASLNLLQNKLVHSEVTQETSDLLKEIFTLNSLSDPFQNTNNN